MTQTAASTDKGRRILVIDPYTHVVGPHQVLARYIEKLRTSYQFTAVVPAEGPAHDALIASGADVLVVSGIEYIRRGMGLRRTVSASLFGARAVARLAQIVRQRNIELIHSATVSCWLGGLAARFTGVPNIYHIHDLTLNSSLPVRLLIGNVLRFTGDHLLCVSNAALDALPAPATNRQKASVLHNGVDTSQFYPRSEARDEVRRELGIPLDSLLVCSFGTLDYRKGQDLLVRAAGKICREIEGVHFLLVGPDSLANSGPEFAAGLRKLVQDSGYESRIRLLGARSDVLRLMQATDIVVQPSRIEAGPIVPLEAMAACVPVIVTNVGANPEEVVDGVTGMMVESEDVSGIANALHQLLLDAQMRQRLGAAGREHVMRNFNLRSQAARLDSIYQRILATQAVA